MKESPVAKATGLFVSRVPGEKRQAITSRVFGCWTPADKRGGGRRRKVQDPERR